MHFMAKSIMDHDRVLRQVLREAVERFNHELLDDEELQMLLDRIKLTQRRGASPWPLPPLPRRRRWR